MSLITGKCTEYSISGNLIQPNVYAPCDDFTSSPCPLFYRSNGAFKCKNKTDFQIQYVCILQP